MSLNTNLLQTSAMPTQTIKPLMAGANSQGQSAYLQQQQQIKNQMAITGKKIGGRHKKSKRNKYYGGAALQIQVPQPPSTSIPPGTGGTTQANYTNITKLAVDQQQQAIYDKTVNGGPSAIDAIQQQNNKLYQSGGKKQKAGHGPKWGCLSGGKYTNRRKHKSRGKRANKRKTKRRLRN